MAREIGIAAPSIYPHFADREAIVLAVVQRIFAELIEAIGKGTEQAGPHPVGALVAGCASYVSYGLAHPVRYGILFSGTLPDLPSNRLPERQADPRNDRKPPPAPNGAPSPNLRAESLALLMRAIAACVTVGRSASTDVAADAAAVWVAIHGAVTLRAALPSFPWPEPNRFVRQLVLPLAHVT